MTRTYANEILLLGDSHAHVFKLVDKASANYQYLTA